MVANHSNDHVNKNRIKTKKTFQIFCLALLYNFSKWIIAMCSYLSQRLSTASQSQHVASRWLFSPLTLVYSQQHKASWLLGLWWWSLDILQHHQPLQSIVMPQPLTNTILLYWAFSPQRGNKTKLILTFWYPMVLPASNLKKKTRFIGKTIFKKDVTFGLTFHPYFVCLTLQRGVTMLGQCCFKKKESR